MLTLARLKFEFTCQQYGISADQGSDWIRKVRMFINDDKTGLRDAAESLAGSPAQSREEVEMVPALSRR